MSSTRCKCLHWSRAAFGGLRGRNDIRSAGGFDVGRARRGKDDRSQSGVTADGACKGRGSCHVDDRDERLYGIGIGTGIASGLGVGIWQRCACVMTVEMLVACHLQYELEVERVSERLLRGIKMRGDLYSDRHLYWGLVRMIWSYIVLLFDFFVLWMVGLSRYQTERNNHWAVIR